MIKTISVRELKIRMESILDDVMRGINRYAISRHGKHVAILMRMRDYEGWLETIEIMRSKKVMRDIKIARQELKEGKGISYSYEA